MFLYKFPSGPLETNAILIGCTKTNKAAVIDPAMGSTGKVLEKAKENQLEIEKILLTHSHWDHFADAFELKNATRAPLYVHFLDQKNLENPGADQIPTLSPISPVVVDQLMREGEIIRVGDLKLEVIHTPGHSPGSVCFYIQEEKVLISGDTLFAGSIGNLSLPTGEPDEMWGSLKKLASLPPDTRVVPGHGGDTTIGKESWLARAKEIFQ